MKPAQSTHLAEAAAEELAALRARDAQFSLILEGVQDHAISMLDPQGGIITWNATAERIKGYALSEVQGKHFRLLFTEADRLAGVPEAELEVATATGKYSGEGRRLRKDGSQFVASVSLSALRDESGALKGFVKVTHDITERVRLADENVRLLEQAKAGEQRLHVALEAGTMGAWEWDIAANRVSWSPTLEEIHGIPRGSFDGTFAAYQSDMHPDDRERVLGIVRSSLQTLLPYRVVYRIIRPDGLTRWLEASATVVVDASAQPVRFVGVCTDITERRQAERLLAFTADASTVLGATLDYDSAIAKVVELAVPAIADWAAVDMLGEDGQVRRVAMSHSDKQALAAAQALAARTLAVAGPENRALRVIRSAEPELETETTEAFWERDYPDPELRRAVRAFGLKSMMCVPLRVRNDVVGAITLTATDSGRRFTATDLSFAMDLARRAGLALDNAKLYESARIAREAADAANRAKDDFLATVSHELRTPLNAMLGWTRLLRGGELPEEKRRHALETIERNAVTQAQLIEDLLDVSRIISGKLRLDVKSVDLVTLVAQAADALRLTCDQKQIQLVSDIDPSVGELRGDASRLQQVAWNLLSNAIKFTPRGGRIRVALSRAGATLRLLVEDTGCGVAPELLPVIFERFKQADGATTRAHGGLGLGLAISRHIVELHGGTIEAKSDGEGLGTAVTVSLPSLLADEGGASAHHAESRLTSAAARSQIRGLNILVVEDEADGRDLLALLLERCGANVSVASSVDEALLAIERQPFDILLSDIGMPGKDGYDLIRAVRNHSDPVRANLPAAALTAYARAEDRRKALDAGFMMHVTKPIETDELISVIASLRSFGAL